MTTRSDISTARRCKCGKLENDVHWRTADIGPTCDFDPAPPVNEGHEPEGSEFDEHAHRDH